MSITRLVREFRRHIGVRRRRDSAHAFMGSACDSWLNAEFALLANRNAERLLGPRSYIYGENGKRDLTVYRDEVARHIVESKVVHPGYRQKGIGRRLARLAEQTRSLRDKDGRRVAVSGLVFAIWFESSAEPAALRRAEFFDLCRRQAERAFPRRRYAAPPGHRFETLLPVSRVMQGTTELTVAAGLLHVRRRDLA